MRKTTSAFLRSASRSTDEAGAISRAKRTPWANGTSHTTTYPLGEHGDLHVHHHPLEVRNTVRWTEVPSIGATLFFIEFIGLLVFYVLECTDVWNSFSVGQTQFFAIHGTLLIYESGLLDELVDGRYVTSSTTYHRLRAATILALLADSLALGRQIWYNETHGWGNDEIAQFVLLVVLVFSLVWRLICVSAAIHTQDPVHSTVIYDFVPASNPQRSLDPLNVKTKSRRQYGFKPVVPKDE